LKRINLKSIHNLLIQSGLVLLPFSHFKWLPELGTTRPISSILFVISLGLTFITYAVKENFRPIQTIRSLYFDHLKKIPGWQALKFWFILIFLGTLSAMITYFYGNFFQALNRLLGYWIIFAILYCGYTAIQAFGIHRTSWWIGVGYLPVLVYALVEALAVLNFQPAVTIILTIRRWVIVDFVWVNRMALFATEPSFIAFQLLLLVTILPFLSNKLLRISTVLIIGIGVIFSKSGTVILILGIYVLFRVLFSLKRPVLVRLLIALFVLFLIIAIAYALYPPLRTSIQELTHTALKIDRLRGMYYSSLIRSSYTRNLVYALIETRGLGLGIGQYGQFWKEIYIRHIDYYSFDILGEITHQLNSQEYMRPWSVILGIGSDLGIIGILILGLFFYYSSKPVHSPHGRAIILAGIVAMTGAYPIVTPHVWLAIAMVTAHELQLISDPK
jgi:hypothetical protein